jgi:hypothetical protein
MQRISSRHIKHKFYQVLKIVKKTSVAVALTSAYESSQCLLLKKPNDVNYIDFANICLVIIDEFAGKYRYEENDVYEWYNMFDHLYNAVIAGQMNVIITCEKVKLDKCINEIGRHAILDHVVDVPLQAIVVKSEVTERKLRLSCSVIYNNFVLLLSLSILLYDFHFHCFNDYVTKCPVMSVKVKIEKYTD